MRIELDQERCVGAGQCVVAAPEVFDQRDDDGVAVLLATEAGGHVAGVERAAAVCPASAIRLARG